MSFDTGSSSSDQNAATSQNSAARSFGGATTSMAPVNAGQLSDALGLASSMYGATGAPYGSGLATQGLGQIGSGGQNAYGLANGAALNQATSTLDGKYLKAGNPYFGRMVGQLGDALKPQIDSQFAAAGRYGSGADAHAFADALSKEAGSLAFQNYGQERQNQLGTLSQVPQLGNAMTAPGATALGAGYQPLQQYLSALASISPGQTSSISKDMTQVSSGNGTSNGNTNGSQDSKGLHIL